MLRLITVLLQTILFISLLHGEEINLLISSDKNIYYTDESVWIKIEIQNNTTDDIDIVDFKISYMDIISIELFNSRDEKLKYKGLILNVNRYSYNTLNSDEKLRKYFNLLHYCGEKFTIFPGMYRLIPDNYTLKIIYSSDNLLIESNKITFEVIEPSGPEKDAHKLFTQGFDKLVRKENTEAEQQFNKLIFKYPNSVYVEKCLWQLRMLYSISYRNFEKSIQAGKSLISKRPESPATLDVLDMIQIDYNRLKKPDKFIEELDTFIVKYEEINPDLVSKCKALRVKHLKNK